MLANVSRVALLVYASNSIFPIISPLKTFSTDVSSELTLDRRNVISDPLDISLLLTCEYIASGENVSIANAAAGQVGSVEVSFDLWIKRRTCVLCAASLPLIISDTDLNFVLSEFDTTESTLPPCNPFA